MYTKNGRLHKKINIQATVMMGCIVTVTAHLSNPIDDIHMYTQSAKDRQASTQQLVLRTGR